MASGDYRACDVCGVKTFYDANLHYVYDDERSEYDTGPLLEENGVVSSYALAFLGSWACVCDGCCKEWTARVVRRSELAEAKR